MGKIVFWVVFIIAALLIARIAARQNGKNQANGRQPKQAPKRGAPPVQHNEAMVRCEHCGIHMPRSEAVLSNGRIWCTEEHAKLGVRP